MANQPAPTRIARSGTAISARGWSIVFWMEASALSAGYQQHAAKPIEPRDVQETAAQSKAPDSFLSHLTIAPVRNSRLVDVEYSFRKPLDYDQFLAAVEQYVGPPEKRRRKSAGV